MDSEEKIVVMTQCACEVCDYCQETGTLYSPYSALPTADDKGDYYHDPEFGEYPRKKCKASGIWMLIAAEQTLIE